MLFNSLSYALFLPSVFGAYWLLRNHLRAQNLFVLVASYLFYGWWDWRFLGLIVVSSVVDYGVGRALVHTKRARSRRALLGLSLGVNLGLLGFFKYFDFFGESLVHVLNSVGLEATWTTLNLVLPVGISFYTFQTLSYTIDVYRRKLEPTRDPVAFLAYVSFFPQLVAGPIERAADLLPQFLRRRTFRESSAVDGLRQILWGLFKKVAVADTCAVFVDSVFASWTTASGLTLAAGAVLFGIQIYGDFSGYSDIAIGSGRLLGFDLTRNFAYPYFSRDIAEFWRRWHISLSTWFRDYLYIPLGGSRVGRGRAIRNILIIFLVSGFWHGANWTFIVWGALNALYFLPLFLSGRNRQHLEIVAADRALPTWSDMWRIAATFSATSVAWVFFRAPTVSDAVGYLHRMLTADFLSPLRLSTEAVALSGVLMVWEWVQRRQDHGLAVGHRARWLRHLAYLVLIWAVAEFSGRPRSFIYFQF